MSKTIVGLFENVPHAERVVDSLVALGVERNHISLISRHQHSAHGMAHTDSPAESAGVGAVGGTVLGGSLGLLAGIVALTIPGIGPAVAAGPLATALGSAALGAGIGAAAGGLLGALVNAGVPEPEAQVYAEGVRRGSTLLAAEVDDDLADTAFDLLRRAGAADIQSSGERWREEGWTRFDEDNEPQPLEGAMAGAATGIGVGAASGPLETLVGGVVGAARGLSGADDDDGFKNGTPQDDSQTGRDHKR